MLYLRFFPFRNTKAMRRIFNIRLRTLVFAVALTALANLVLFVQIDSYLEYRRSNEEQVIREYWDNHPSKTWPEWFERLAPAR